MTPVIQVSFLEFPDQVIATLFAGDVSPEKKIMRFRSRRVPSREHVLCILEETL